MNSVAGSLPSLFIEIKASHGKTADKDETGHGAFCHRRNGTFRHHAPWIIRDCSGCGFVYIDSAPRYEVRMQATCCFGRPTRRPANSVKTYITIAMPRGCAN